MLGSDRGRGASALLLDKEAFHLIRKAVHFPRKAGSF